MNCLTSVYLVDLVGLDKLTNSSCILSLFRGLGCVIGPYICGINGNYFILEHFYFTFIIL